MIKKVRGALVNERHGFCCGIDEVGRGALAGPVVAAAVILPRGWYPKGLADSKTLSKSKRNHLHTCMISEITFGIGLSFPDEIDRINIRNATLRAMKRATVNLGTKVNVALIDGKDIPIQMKMFSKAFVSGDSYLPAIAAASIVAKVYRDDLMFALAKTHPEYGWQNNVGYGTSHHLLALKEYGRTSHHRCSFSPIYNMLCQENKLSH